LPVFGGISGSTKTTLNPDGSTDFADSHEMFF
jgi:hypothetical protein